MHARKTTALIMLRSMVRVHLAPLPGPVKALVRALRGGTGSYRWCLVVTRAASFVYPDAAAWAVRVPSPIGRWTSRGPASTQRRGLGRACDMDVLDSVSKATGVPLGGIIGSVILLAYAGVILYLNGRRNPRRSRDAVMAGRLRATVWATIAVAILSASFKVYLITGISIVAILSASAVLIVLGVRNLRH